MLHSIPAMLLFAAAAILTLWDQWTKRDGILPFFGGLAGTAGLLVALIDGATLREGLTCVLVLLLLSLRRRRGGTVS